METKKNEDPVDEFCMAVDSQIEKNEIPYKKLKEERILKNDSKEQVPLLKTISNKRKK